jgi:hypothetical protein
MNIKEVKTAMKIGEFKLRTDGHRNKIKLDYSSNMNKDVLNDDVARIYLFVVDGIIKKIGGSSGKGGIKNTMNFYTCAMTGSPGVPRFVIHLLLAEALEQKKKVELYMITSPKVLATVNGLFGSKKVEIASFKEMEDFCKSDYYSVEKSYPDWNFQENHSPYPMKLAEKHNEYHKNRLKKYEE